MMMRKNGSGQSLRIRRKRMRFKINMSFLCREWEVLLSTLREEVTGSLLLSYFCLWKYYSYSVLNSLELLHLSLLSRFYRIVAQLGLSKKFWFKIQTPPLPSPNYRCIKKNRIFMLFKINQNPAPSGLCSLGFLFLFFFFCFFFFLSLA